MTTAEILPDRDQVRAAKDFQIEELVPLFADRAALAHDGVPLKDTTPDRQEQLLRWSAIFVRATDRLQHADAEARVHAALELRRMEPPLTADRMVDHLFDTWQTDMARRPRSGE